MKSVPLAMAISLLGACATEEQLSSTEAAVWTVETDPASTHTWDSFLTDDLSVWKSIDCHNTYGSEWLLVGLKAFEDSGSLDRFIARLEGTCAGYRDSNDVFIRDGRDETDLIFTSDHQTSSESTEIEFDHYASDVQLELDTFGDFVQAIRFNQVEILSSGALGNKTGTTWIGPGGTLIGPLRTLTCPANKVVTGLKLRYDTQKGKIRKVTITCRPLADL